MKNVGHSSEKSVFENWYRTSVYNVCVDCILHCNFYVTVLAQIMDTAARRQTPNLEGVRAPPQWAWNAVMRVRSFCSVQPVRWCLVPRTMEQSQSREHWLEHFLLQVCTMPRRSWTAGLPLLFHNRSMFTPPSPLHWYYVGCVDFASSLCDGIFSGD